MSKVFDAISIDTNEWELMEEKRIAEMERGCENWIFENCGELQQVVSGDIVMTSEEVHEFYYNLQS